MNFRGLLGAILTSGLLFCNLQAYQYDFAICAVFQNEARFIKEWIEYHKIVGAQHFYLYNNESQDDYLKILQPYIDEGSVELVDWNVPDFQHAGQKRAYLDAINKTKDSVKWLALIDLDEYLVPKIHDSVLAWLSEYESDGIGGIGINWQMFGTSFVPRIERNQLLTEKLTLKALENHSENLHIKSIVRPEYVIEPVHVHHFEYSEGYAQINSSNEPFTGAFSPYINTDKIQINHYWTKDEEFLHEIKIPRRQNWGETLGSIEERVNALNQVEDTSIARFLPLLRRQMFPGEMWEDFKSLQISSDLLSSESKNPRFQSGSYLALNNPGEIVLLGQTSSSTVGHRVAEFGDTTSELLAPEDSFSYSYDQERALKALIGVIFAVAVCGIYYRIRYIRVHRVASETPH